VREDSRLVRDYNSALKNNIAIRHSFPPIISAFIASVLDAYCAVRMESQIESAIETMMPPHHRATTTVFGGRFDNPWVTWEDRSFSVCHGPHYDCCT
jgi:hypothetical protein